MTQSKNAKPSIPFKFKSHIKAGTQTRQNRKNKDSENSEEFDFEND